MNRLERSAWNGWLVRRQKFLGHFHLANVVGLDMLRRTPLARRTYILLRLVLYCLQNVQEFCIQCCFSLLLFLSFDEWVHYFLNFKCQSNMCCSWTDRMIIMKKTVKYSIQSLSLRDKLLDLLVSNKDCLSKVINVNRKM